jgi:hypothetical protein
MSVSRRWCAVLAITAAAAAADLNALLLTPDDIDTAMNATAITVDTTTSTLVDDSPHTTPAAIE